jgi:hypothetical protein
MRLAFVFLPQWTLRSEVVILMADIPFDLAHISLLPRLLPLCLTVTLLDEDFPFAFLGFAEKG